jgi:hypothetical protein
MIQEITIARILLAWLFILLALITFMSCNDKNVKIHIGPSDELIIFGTTINTNKKYVAVVMLCIFNSAIRTMNSNIIHPWVINNVQDTKIYFKVNIYNAYEITAIHAVYGFIDWYFYMNIILSQIDLFMVEMVVDLIMAMLTTKYYLDIKKQSLALLPIEAEYIKNYILTGQDEIDGA